MVLKPRIKALIENQSKYRSKEGKLQRELSRLVRSKDADSAGIKEKLTALRKLRQEFEATRTKLEKDLKDLLTLEQEAKLVTHRVLR